MKMIIGTDHYGTELTAQVANILQELGVEYEVIGATSREDRTSLEDIIPAVIEKIDDETEGVLICGTGVGVNIGANRFKGIRASLCTSAQTARDAKQYDKANTLCLSSWHTDDVRSIVEAWLDTEYDGSESRLKMFAEFDRWGK